LLDSNIGALKAKYNKQIFRDNSENGDEDEFRDDFEEALEGGEFDDDLKTHSTKKPAKPVDVSKLLSMVDVWRPKPSQKPFVVNSTPENLTERILVWFITKIYTIN